MAGNLYNKCKKRLVEQGSSYSDYSNAICGLYRMAEPQEALWHCDFAEGSPLGLMVFTTQECLKIATLYT